jgi:hypothetical protein
VIGVYTAEVLVGRVDGADPGNLSLHDIRQLVAAQMPELRHVELRSVAADPLDDGRPDAYLVTVTHRPDLTKLS